MRKLQVILSMILETSSTPSRFDEAAIEPLNIIYGYELWVINENRITIYRSYSHSNLLFFGDSSALRAG